MFYPEKICNIKYTDRVLEIGPGATPHARSDEFLELIFENEADRIAQSGHIGILKSEKPIHYYDGGKFPFDDNSFDYIICSHVLEHVTDVDFFLKELTRVAKKGYLEFPTLYYDYLYNIPEHLQLLNVIDGCIYYLRKSDTPLSEFDILHVFFQNTLAKGHHDLLNDNQDVFFKGFEWDSEIKYINAGGIRELVDFEKQAQVLQKTNKDPWIINYDNISLKNHLKYKGKKLFRG